VDRGRAAPVETKRRALWIGAALVVVAAVLYAVSGGNGHKGQLAALSSTNPAPASPPAPTSTLLSTTGAVASAAVGSGPKIQFGDPVHDFGRIKSGEMVKHTYVFTNVGGAILQVTNVKGSCGCTTAGEWTRQVEPGKSGNIPIQFNSAGFSGQVGKSIAVACNDTNQPTVELKIKAIVWKPIDVTPQLAVLNVTSDSPSNATTVHIVNNEEAPLALSAPESSNPAFATELKTIQPGKAYQLIVRTVPPLAVGIVQGQITLKTSSTNLPVIQVGAWANLQQPVMVIPAQITLPATPLAKPTPLTVSIRNNGTSALVLTDPAVNAQGVDVQIRAVQPGRYFTLTASFPTGFELAMGEKLEVSVKSNHPQFPMIKVPVIPAPRPAVTGKPPGAPGVSRAGSP
jgi:hypothetical protein